MDKKNLLVIAIVLLILISLGLILNNFLLTGKIIKEKDAHSSTIAICNETNYCEDYEVECEGNKTIKTTPTGFAIQQAENWKDPRENHNPENPCSSS